MTSPTESAVIVSSGVDWLSVTQSRPPLERPLEFWALPLLRYEEERGNERRPWSMKGYEGFCCGSVQIGTGTQGALLRLSSHMADSYWQEAWALSDVCSRVDLQMTVRYEGNLKTRILKHYAEALSHKNRTNQSGTVSVFSSSDGSSTLYLGKRSSEQFGRCYDKEVESQQDEWSNCVRYELELKGARAMQAMHTLGTKNPRFESGFREVTPPLAACTPDAVSRWISSRVAEWFAARGCALPVTLPTLGIYMRTPPRTDFETKLRWASRVIRPLVTTAKECSRLPELLDALGLLLSDDQKVVYDSAGQGPLHGEPTHTKDSDESVH